MNIVETINNLIDNFFKKKDEYYFLRLCYLTLGFIFFVSFTSCFLFIFHISINVYGFILALLLWVFFYFVFFYKLSDKKLFYKNFIFGCFLLALCIIASSLLLDYTWDGWSYHMPAVLELKNGWNPLYQHRENMPIWSAHYPKFIWVYGGVLYKVFDSFAAGASFNLIISCSAFFLSMYILKNLKFKSLLVFIVSLILGFNFISVGQFFSYYNDGVLGICILSLGLIFYWFLKNKRANISYFSIVIASMYLSILANIKFNGSLYAFIIAMFIILYMIIKKIKIKKIILSILIIGSFVLIPAANTYLNNYIYHKNLGYPIVGKNKVDIITAFTPAFIHKDDGNMKSFIKSFACDYTSSNCKIIPFYKIEIEDLYAASSVDTRLGFGKTYQLIVLLLAILLILSIPKIINEIRNKNIKNLIKEYYPEMFLILILLIIFYINPATWWARYVPYMYLVPLLLLLFFYHDWLKKNFKNIICYLIIVIYVFNLLFFGSLKIIRTIKNNLDLNNQIAELKKLSGDNLFLTECHEGNYLYKQIIRKELLNRNGVIYKEVTNNSCQIMKHYESLGVDLLSCDDEEN